MKLRASASLLRYASSRGQVSHLRPPEAFVHKGARSVDIVEPMLNEFCTTGSTRRRSAVATLHAGMRWPPGELDPHAGVGCHRQPKPGRPPALPSV